MCRNWDDEMAGSIGDFYQATLCYHEIDVIPWKILFSSNYVELGGLQDLFCITLNYRTQ